MPIKSQPKTPKPLKLAGAIRVTGSDEFKRLISRIADDIVTAHVHWRLFQELSNSLAKAPVVVAQSRTFWYLTVRAHAELALACLCRVFDQERSSLHLRSWLEAIRGHLTLFSEKSFRERMVGNPFVDSLAAEPRTPNAAVLGGDISRCSSSDPLVKKLMFHRNNLAAHISAKLTATRASVPSKLSLKNREVELLLRRAIRILNRYSSLFSAETHSTRMVGHDDYGYVIESVALRVEAARAEFQQLRARVEAESLRHRQSTRRSNQTRPRKASSKARPKQV